MSTQDTIAPVSDAAPVVETNPSAAPAPATPATEVTTPANPQGEETVTVKKSDWDRTQGRQSYLDKKEATITRREQALARGEVFSFKQSVSPAQPVSPSPAGDDDITVSTAEDRKAERGLIALALKPEYRDVLDADPTFRDMLTKAPLSILPLYAADSVDAEDAVQQITEYLDDKKSKLTPAAPVAPVVPVQVVAPSTVQTGAPSFGEQVATEGLQDKAYTEAVASGTVKGIAEGLKHRFSQSARR